MTKRTKLDWCVVMVGGVAASTGLLAQVAGFALAFLFDDPITGDLLLDRGFWVAGLGGAGLVYGMLVGASTPPKDRWLAALLAVGGTPLWGVLSLPLVLMPFILFGLIPVVLCVERGLRVLRRTGLCIAHSAAALRHFVIQRLTGHLGR